ncbi:MAG: cation diffusion facilitator family transporter [Planctomycetota bacterium]|jgi:cation diffusion facilitator family transporter
MAAKGGHDGTRKAVLAALFGNFGVAVSKFVAFALSGSSAMLAEAFHSVADTVNQVFLLLGLRLGRRPPDEEHPFGYGRERYFWAFIVALSIFSLGALFSVLEGIKKIRDPHDIEHPLACYGALLIAALFESYALRIAWIEFREWRKTNPGRLWQALTQSKSPTILVVLFEDSAALLGILVAAAGISLTVLTGQPVYDGAASLVIGGILFAAALFVGWRTRGLLIGEAATVADRRRIREAVEGVPQVVALLQVLTLHLGPEDVLVNLNVNFADGLDTDALEAAIDEIEKRIRAAVPTAKRIFIEAESIRGIGA